MVCVSGLVCGRVVCGLRGSEARPGYVCDARFGKGEGAAALGEGMVGWRRTLLEDRSLPAQCSPATSSLLRVAQVGGGLKHAVEAASGVRARRRGSLGARQPHRRGVHPGATPSSLFMVEVSQEAPKDANWVSLSVFECLWVALGGFECL